MEEVPGVVVEIVNILFLVVIDVLDYFIFLCVVFRSFNKI
jgi:hypothetical protein